MCPSSRGCATAAQAGPNTLVILHDHCDSCKSTSKLSDDSRNLGIKSLERGGLAVLHEEAAPRSARPCDM